MLRFEQKSAYGDGGPINMPGVSPRLAKLLFERGVRTELELEEFLYPGESQLCDPMRFSDMAKAVARIERAMAGGERICIYGDYDADGVCATAMLLRCLSSRGADVMIHIPSRHGEGYGMNAEAVRDLREAGVQLIITVDNGIKAIDEIREANALGMDVIVTDHHIPGETLPAAAAVVCPTIENEQYANRDICGAGVAFKLLEAIGISGAERQECLALTGLATVADVVPLLGENRALAALGIRAMREGNAPPGLRALICVAGLQEDALNSRDLGFGLAPRLNAAGRMDDARTAVELLTGSDGPQVSELAQRLDKLNADRQSEENAICAEAFDMAEGMNLTFNRAIVLKSPQWNAGVVGIAAARVMERYYRPTLLLCEKDGILTGSARSIPGVDIHAALKACEGRFIRFGGHSHAAGLTMRSEELPAFCAELEAALGDLPEELFIPTRFYEMPAELTELTLSLAEELERLAPFGEGNPVPVFFTGGLRLAKLRRMGRDAKHIKATAVKNGSFVESVGFSMGNRFDELIDMERTDAAYTVSVNDYKGMRSLQMQLRELRPCVPEDAAAYISARRDKFIDALLGNILYNSSRGAVCATACDTAAMAAELIRGSFAGTLILISTAEGAERFFESPISGLPVDVSFGHNKRSPFAYHAAVLAPVLSECDLSRFDNIVLLDGMPEGTAAWVTASAPGARLFVPEEGFSLPEEARLAREDVAACYRALKKTARAFMSAPEAADYLQNTAGLPRCRCLAAFEVMRELGFIDRQEGGMTLSAENERRELTQSAIYTALTGLQEEEK